jgi:hypothetical protein
MGAERWQCPRCANVVSTLSAVCDNCGYDRREDKRAHDERLRDLMDRLRNLPVKGRENGPGFTYVEVPVEMRDELIALRGSVCEAH